jgi:hypothetical protein
MSFLTGAEDSSELAQQQAGVQAQDQNAYNINGVQAYTNQLGQNAQAIGNLNQPNLNAQIAPQIGQQTQLQQYLQGVGMGTQQTAADAMLQSSLNNQQANNLSSMAANRGSVNPALALRQTQNANAQAQGQNTQQAAQQKLQEQFSGAQQAAGLSQSINQQVTGASQQQYQNQLNNILQQNQTLGQQFQGNLAQTNLNVQYQQNNQNYQEFIEQQQVQQAQQQAAGLHGLLTAAVGAAAGAATMGLTGGRSGVGSLVGGLAQAGNSFLGGGSTSSPNTQLTLPSLGSKQ